MSRPLFNVSMSQDIDKRLWGPYEWLDIGPKRKHRLPTRRTWQVFWRTSLLVSGEIGQRTRSLTPQHYEKHFHRTTRAAVLHGLMRRLAEGLLFGTDGDSG